MRRWKRRGEGGGLYSNLVGNGEGGETWFGLVHVLKGDPVRFARGLGNEREKEV